VHGLAPPALGERRHRGLVRCFVAMCEAPLGATRGRAKNSLDGKSGHELCHRQSSGGEKKAPLESELKNLGINSATIAARQLGAALV
jgi:hypothetical protein